MYNDNSSTAIVVRTKWTLRFWLYKNSKHSLVRSLQFDYVVIKLFLLPWWLSLDCERVTSILQFLYPVSFLHCFLQNYSSMITLHPEIIDGRPGTMVIESFVVDVPDGNTKDETCYFVEALIKCNLKSLADVSERLAVQGRTEPIDRC